MIPYINIITPHFNLSLDTEMYLNERARYQSCHILMDVEHMGNGKNPPSLTFKILAVTLNGNK